VTRRLTRLGRRGEGWVAVQFVLVLVIVAAGALGPRWLSPAHDARTVIAIAVAVGGLYLFAGAATGLGKQLTPFPRPVAGGSVKRSGVYGLVRHPMYGGILLLALACALLSSPLALVPWAVAAVFLDAKRRREEAWLVEAHPEYEQYRASVTSRFVPLVW
jgi:protein-S-isoprenylcysteine O-methyltransferase Ste14